MELVSCIKKSGTGNVKRKVKVSKNKKKSWNKFCDIKDVEDFLEEKRFDERIGGRQSDKPNEEIFFVDHQIESNEPVKLKKIQKPLKCHSLIGAYSCVTPPVNVDVNRYPKRLKERNDKRFNKFLKRRNIKLQKLQDGQIFNDKHSINDSPNFDPWAEDKKIDDDIVDLVAYRDEITEKKTPKVPCHRYQKPSLLPAVEVPHAGASYNPTHEDHQELLREAVDVEEKTLKNELHLERVLTHMFPTKEEAPTEKSILEEMSQGLFDEADEEEEETENNNFKLRNPPVLAEDRLPKSRKRKRKELKEEAKRRVVEKLSKQRFHDIYRLRSIKSSLKKQQEISERRHKQNLERKAEKMFTPRILSSQKYQPPDIEVNLTEEITGSLRTLKSDGNLLEDRYKSFQRRNMIETRIKQKMKRKYKLKLQVKRSHRNFE